MKKDSKKSLTDGSVNKIISVKPNIDSKTDNNIKLEKKICYFEEIIQKTILSAQKYKLLDIIGANDLNTCIQTLELLFTQLSELKYPIIHKKKYDKEQMVTTLQEINEDLSGLFRIFGTQNINELISVCFGHDYIQKNIEDDLVLQKYDVIAKYVHPISYKLIPWKNNSKPKSNSTHKVLQKNRIIEDFMIVETAENLDCFDLARTSKSFQTKVYGIKLSIHNYTLKKTMVISGVVDDITLSCINMDYIRNKIDQLDEEKPKDIDFQTNAFKRFLVSLTVKELLIYNNDELYNRFMGYINQVNLIKQKSMSQIVKEFIGNELYGQRTTLIQLLLKADESEYQYLAYLLYDLLSNDNNGNIDSFEQTMLFDSLPWNVKKYFRDAMKQTIQYTNNLSNFDNNKIPLEQQICLMKANDSIKEKAMIKLKEVKSKSEDSGSKARQYLDGLLRIPFGIYKEEPILVLMGTIYKNFNELIGDLNNSSFPIDQFPIKDTYTSLELNNYFPILYNDYLNNLNDKMIKLITENIKYTKRSELINIICFINILIKKHKLNIHKLCHSGKKIEYMQAEIYKFIHFISKEKNLLIGLNEHLKFKNSNDNSICILDKQITNINTKLENVNTYISNVKTTLDKAVHGHDNAKRHIERIIGQWINGEESGYCFGFEGPPGVGKTSLAKKGIAECLTDNENVARPFSLIAVGGSSNGSTLEGHNYTYVGSTWGKIVDILMDKKCMNPIIFIDELDKVSRTEHGREIIGILTHLIDATQNDAFQDKYFNGIDLDLSKVLFIFSYNDPSVIDKILLDRIHRVKFDNLTLDDKLTITHDYILPEIFGKFGLNDVIKFNDEIITYIIDEYTCEPGVRKLKEILFEIIGEINLCILTKAETYPIPYILTKNLIKYTYLKDRHEVRHKMIHSKPVVGIINGLWANAMGQGGIIQIETSFFPAKTFLDLQLTGMQGDVMKESMSVAKTLAWSMLSKNKQKKLFEELDETKLQGIHIHCPEGAVPKDGPSAGTAITIVLHSLLSGKKIKNDFAITGEMCLQGKVTAIGGLDLKILGGIRAGVKNFIYPKENDKEFLDFWKKYKDKEVVKGIKFHEVEHIEEVVKLIFIK
jgi:ATP-dependent Lon protease